MGKLVLFNFILILIAVAVLWAVKRLVKTPRAEYAVFLVAPLVTILCHYSSFIYRALCGEGAIAYLAENPNLLLPIYPCNVVMWCALIYGLMPTKESKAGMLFSDYLFWFGIVSTLVGMFANVDFINNPTLANFEVTKSILAHATLLFNVLLIPVFGRLRPRFFRNMWNIFLSVVAMYVIGLYCNLVLHALVSAEMAYYKNAMFILHSPFDGLPFLRYPIIAVAALFLYAIIFTVCDILTAPRGARWFNHLPFPRKTEKSQ